MNSDHTQKENELKLVQEKVAGKSGLAVVFADSESPALAKSNNNSMCHFLYNSEEFAPECAKFCGNAFKWTAKTGKTVSYKCYAGLNCLAVPVKIEQKQLVSIIGRTFFKAEDYRKATERAISGDWREFPTAEFFENVLLSGSMRDLEAVAERFENFNLGTSNRQNEFVAKTVKNEDEKKSNGARETQKTGGSPQATNDAKNAKDKINPLLEGLPSPPDSLLSLTYKQACAAVLQVLANNFSIFDSAWLERIDNQFETVLRRGKLEKRQMQIGIAANDGQILEAARRQTSIELCERSDEDENAAQTVYLFPVAVGGEIKGAVVAGEIGDQDSRRKIGRLCATIAPQLEILRLREQLLRRGWLEKAVRKFNESVRDVDAEDFWSKLTRTFAELMKSERSSLLVYDDKSGLLTVKAATGERADFIRNEKENVGDRIAKTVLQKGEPLVVENVRAAGFSSAPAERSYKTDSFISYPITIGGRNVGVLNITDRTDKKNYDRFDLELLNAIAPQIGILLDRVSLKRQAGEFEQLSVTDALTGLLNRRYLEERLDEEIKRSNRHGFAMSFMMIDVDDFKAYNDNFSHPEGDRALQIVAHCLRETLRGADVAARYGGEEFSILLPQTTHEEAAVIADRIRRNVETTRFPNRQVTVSIGVANSSPSVNTASKLIAAADEALYAAKHAGRNRIQAFEDLRKATAV